MAGSWRNHADDEEPKHSPNVPARQANAATSETYAALMVAQTDYHGRPSAAVAACPVPGKNNKRFILEEISMLKPGLGLLALLFAASPESYFDKRVAPVLTISRQHKELS